MLDFTDDDFNDTDLSSTDCNSDKCKKTKDRLQKRATAANKRAAELILEINKLKNRFRELTEMETTQLKFDQILENMKKIPMKSDLHEFGNELFSKIIQYFGNSSTNSTQDNATNETNGSTPEENVNTQKKLKPLLYHKQKIIMTQQILKLLTYPQNMRKNMVNLRPQNQMK